MRTNSGRAPRRRAFGRVSRHVSWLGALALAALLLASPGASARGAARAMRLWYGTVAPALFPFLALMPLLTCPDAARAYQRLLGPAARALFRLPGAAAPAMLIGMAAGSPAGAIAARRLAAGAGMDRGQLCRVAAATAGFSPAFLVVGIGAGLLDSPALGWRLLGAQLLTQLTMALLLRRAWPERTGAVDAPRSADAPPVTAAALTLMGVCGYMALFGALAAALRERLGDGAADALLCLMDVPSGAGRLCELFPPGGVRLALLAAMCGFGGGCVAAQNLAALAGCGMRAGEYLGLRALAAAIAAGWMALLSACPGAFAPPLRAGALARPFALAALLAALAAVPVLVRKWKSVF